MLNIDVICLLSELIEPTFSHGVVGRAYQKGLFDVKMWNPRDYTTDLHKTVDDRPYGGGPGMVMKYEPLQACFNAIETHRSHRGIRIYLSPQGEVFSHAMAKRFASAKHLVFLAGRYEGVDERLIEDCIDEEVSLGDYVLSGGELGCAVLIDAIVRLLPNALGDALSAQQDSFAEGRLDCPHYTRPEVINDKAVPPVLLSGDHQKIMAWREQQSWQRTLKRRPDLIAERDGSKQ